MAMFRFYLLFGVFLIAGALSAQNQISELEARVPSTSGVARAELLIQIADARYQAGQYDLSEKAADEADALSQKLRATAVRAKALNRIGRAMLAQNKRKTASKFESSLDLLKKLPNPDKALALDNLNNLKKIAQRAGRTREVERIDEQIARVDQMGAEGVAGTENRPVTKSELQQSLQEMQQALMTKNSTLQDNESKFVEESERLQAELAAKQEQINLMTEEQAKAEVMLMQQKIMLDSVVFRSQIDALTVNNTQLALREAETNRKFLLASVFAALLLAGGSLYSYFKARQNARLMTEKNKIIRSEQERSEKLLLNILPGLIAEELKNQGRTNARFFEQVSVLFADFVGFSRIAEQLSPQQLVNELDTCFQAFDEIIARHGLEKIKTIGDCYMVAGGVPDNSTGHLHRMVLAARDMQRWLSDWNIERARKNLPRYDARIGIHHGPVVAGVVGSKKFAFDIWGDTVNIAARVEQAGESGKINISGDAYQLLKNDFECQYRGKIPVKNKGEIDMYFVMN